MSDDFKLEKTTLAGGCFWCIESAFTDIWGVESTYSGYMGGDVENPSYEQVCLGLTGHYEAVSISFYPEKISFLQLLEIFWRHIDPLDDGGQFADRGSQYRTAIFYHTFDQKRQALFSKQMVQKLFKEPIVTQILAAAPFYVAESDHQRYCLKHPLKYRTYSAHHIPRLNQLWSERQFDYPREELKEKLTSSQYHVTQEEGTEPAFQNAYWNNLREGIYVDIVTNEPLFASTEQYPSSCGWPSFTGSINPEAIEEADDYKLGVYRIQIRSKKAQTHLGHLFTDGPSPKGIRYCINSASLRFIPKEKMEEEGFAHLLSLFDSSSTKME